MKKIKTYVLTVSRHFPSTHYRKGEETFFPEEIITARIMDGYLDEYSNKQGLNFEIVHDLKLTTIRSNYELWKKRIDDVQSGNAVLSLRYWSRKPYRSKQVEFMQLYKDSGIGIQKIDFSDDYLYTVRIDNKRFSFSSDMIAENDGLSEDDFEQWFKGYDLSKPMAIIHFTKFRY